MAQQNSNLPEGTDRVIPGAMETDTSDLTGGAGSSTGTTPGVGTSGSAAGGSATIGGSAGSTGSTGSSGAGSTGSMGGSGGSGSGSSSGQSGSSGLMEKVRSGTDQLSEQAADKARGFVGQGIERSAEALSNVSRLISDTASGLDERLGPEYGDYARRAAETIDSTANRIASKDPDELIDDTREFIRKSPGVALAGAAIVGFALARLVKSGLEGAGEDEGDQRNSDSRRS